MASDDSEFKYFQMIPQPGPCLNWWHDVYTRYPSFEISYYTNVVNIENIYHHVGILRSARDIQQYCEVQLNAGGQIQAQLC